MLRDGVGQDSPRRMAVPDWQARGRRAESPVVGVRRLGGTSSVIAAALLVSAQPTAAFVLGRGSPDGDCRVAFGGVDATAGASGVVCADGGTGRPRAARRPGVAYAVLDVRSRPGAQPPRLGRVAVHRDAAVADRSIRGGARPHQARLGHMESGPAPAGRRHPAPRPPPPHRRRPAPRPPPPHRPGRSPPRPRGRCRR